MEYILQSMKLLSDETRLRVIMLLYQGKFCVCQLTGITEIPQPKISKALSKMRDLNLVTDTRQDKFVYYSLNEDIGLLKPLLDEIMTNIEDYPVLESDQKNKAKKDLYLNQCSKIQL